MPESTRRLFFALWPDAATRAALDAAGLELAGRRVRRVPAANLHLTLAFAGSVTGAVQACMEAAAPTVSVPPFELVIDTVGHFPRPRILWLGASAVPPALESLANGLRRALVDCGLAPEIRTFQAHVTLARKFGQPLPERPFTPVTWAVGDFALVESVHTDSGARYLPLRSWPLESHV